MKAEKDLALTTLQLLVNATGAEFEDQEMAVQILEQLIIETFKNGQIDNKDFSKSCTCDQSPGETWCCNHCGLPTNKISK